MLEKIAKNLGVEIRDGWYNVANITTIDGSPWVEEKEFLEILESENLI